jgi:4-amino-4-deoxy-L-arabinose transferase-like glycosyltransferase
MESTDNKAGKSGIGWVFGLLAFYFVLQVIVRIAMPPTLGLDEAEQSFRSQWLAAGYGPQPPFYNWLQYAIFSFSGVSVLALAATKNTLLFISYLLYGLTARRLLRNDALVVMATLGLVTLPQVAFEMQRDLTHTVAVFFSGCLFLYGFIRALHKGDTLAYLITGVGIGLGFLSKYNFALLPISALLAVLFDQQMRKRVFDWRIGLTALVTIAIATPHLFWLKDNLGFATARTLEKLTDNDHASYILQVLTGIGSLLLAVIGFCAVTVVVFAIVFRKPLLSAFSGSSEWTRLFGRMMLFSMLGILMLVFFGGASQVKDRWLVPLFFVMPLYLALKIEASKIDAGQALRRFMPIVAIIMIAVPSILFGRVAMASLNGDYERLNTPFLRAAEALRQKADPSAIVAEGSLLAGNLRKDLYPVTVVSLDYPGFKPDIAISKEHPLLIVWSMGTAGESGLSAKATEWLKQRPDLAGAIPEISTIDVPYFYAHKGETYRFGYALIAPPAP